MDPKDIVAGHLQDKKGTMTPASPRDIATSVIRGVGNPVNTDDIQEEDFAHLLLVDNLKKLSIDPRDFRFFGKSSGAMLVQTAMELKNNYTGETHDLRRPILASKRPEFWEIRPVRYSFHLVCLPPNVRFSGNAKLMKFNPQTTSSPMRISSFLLWNSTSIMSTSSCPFFTDLPSKKRSRKVYIRMMKALVRTYFLFVPLHPATPRIHVSFSTVRNRTTPAAGSGSIRSRW